MELSTPAKTLSQAKIVLDRDRRELDPSKSEDAPFYVERDPSIHDALIDKAISAHTGNRAFQWYFTGHMGAGKSTEINQIINNTRITGRFIPRVYPVKDRLDVQNLDFTDLILAMAQSVLDIAQTIPDVSIPPDLETWINSWGKEIELTSESNTSATGKAGASIKSFFLRLEAEVQTGSSKRKIIREKMQDTLSDFIRLIDTLTLAIQDKTLKKPLIVIDTLDHVDDKRVVQIFTEHLASITKPSVSLLVVIPLHLLHEEDFMARVQNIWSFLPNVKIFDVPSETSAEFPRPVLNDGRVFFQKVLEPLVDLSLFEEDALDEIIRLSCGMIRDLIGVAGSACRHADRDNPSGKVNLSHVTKVLDESKSFYRRILTSEHYVILKKVKDAPRIKGFEGMGPLLHMKAVICYSNGEDWYGLHPAVEAIMNEP